MGILKQIIQKKIENEYLLLKNNEKIIALQEHVHAYLMCLFFLGRRDNNLIFKNNLYLRLCRSTDSSFVQCYNKILSYRQEEDKVILEALNILDSLEDKQDLEYDLYKPFTWGMLGYEYGVYLDD